MKDKEKQIEEIKQIINERCEAELEQVHASSKGGKVTKTVDTSLIAKDIYKYLTENSVVLSREELQKIINQTKETEKNYYKKVVIPQERKETAEKIYQQLQEHGTTYVKKWIAKQFGVEIKE